MHRLTSILIASLLFTACRDSTSRPVELYRQRLPHSRLVIYKFLYASDFAFTEEYTGLNSDIAFPADTLMTPVDQETTTVNGVQINLAEYKETYGSARLTELMEYKFDSCSETADSLIFYNVGKKFGDRDFPPTVAFVKGNIQLMSINDSVNHIAIDQLVIQRGEIYRPKTRELVPNQPVVGVATYYFYPNKPILPSSLSDNGIFKSVY